MDFLGKVDYAATASYLALPLVAVHSIPAIRSIIQRAKNSYKPISQDHYSDEDGEATSESLRAFSDKWERSAILFFSEAGLLVTLALSVFETLNGNNLLIWLQFGVWILLSIQAIAFITEPRSTVRYDLGTYAFWASLFASSVPITELVPVIFSGRTSHQNTWIILQFTQTGCALLRALFTILLPRCAELYYKDRPVDPEKLVSMLNRVTFGYALGLMKTVSKVKKLKLKDLPQLAAFLRAKVVLERSEKHMKGRTILKALSITYRWELILQTILTLIHCLLTFGTQISLFLLLKNLEQRGTPHFSRAICHTLNLAMTVMSISGVNLETATNWLSCKRIGLPVTTGLTAVTYSKAMRLKDESFETLQSSKKNKTAGQNVMNFLNSDVDGIASLADYNWIIVHTILKLAFGAGFLVQLLGWPSALAGFVAPFVMLPLTIFFANLMRMTRFELSKSHDATITAVDELYRRIESIKLFGYEIYKRKKTEEKREKELLLSWKLICLDITVIAVTQFSPAAMSAISLAFYAFFHGDLPVSVAFTSLTIFKSLEFTFSQIPGAIGSMTRGLNSTARFDEFLNMPDKVRNTVPGDQIVYENASVTWTMQKKSPSEETSSGEAPSGEAPEGSILQDMNFQLPKEGLTVIYGPTGSGKSLLLKSFLSETKVVGGTLQVPVPPSEDDRHDERANEANWILDSAHALVAETPWNENVSIKDNILFGLPVCEKRLKKVLFACALEKDLESLKDGVLTDIAPDGKNLSVGQQWRVALARALYSRAGIIFMEDILSAVDPVTARHIFEHALTGELAKGRARVLVTHHVKLCWPRTDYFLQMGENGIKNQGPGPANRSQESNHLADILDFDNYVTSHTSGENGKTIDDHDEDPAPEFVLKEQQNTGEVKLKYYRTFIEAGGSWPFWIMALSLYLSYTGAELGRTWWIKIWAESTRNTNTHRAQYTGLSQTFMPSNVSADPDYDMKKYLGVYFALSASVYFLVITRTYILRLGAYRASKAMFNEMTDRLIHTKKEWMDATPIGRIKTRYSSDIPTLDTQIATSLGAFADVLLQVAAVMLAEILVHWSGILIGAALLFVCWKIGGFYLPSFRETNRLKRVTQSQLNTHIDSTINARLTICTFGKENAYSEKTQNLSNDVTRTSWASWICRRWLGNTMGTLGCVFSSVVAVLAIELQGMPVAKAAVALSYTSRFWSPVVAALRDYANLQGTMNAVERVVEYSQLNSIEPQGGRDAKASWPTQGRIEVHDLEVCYPRAKNDAEEIDPVISPPVLKGINFTVESNERIGIVGRTGAGKSTLALAIFRFLEASKGQILIDGEDISTLKLHDLRSRLGMVPQSPPVFSGTVRSNLDLFEEGYSDAELYDVLARVNLISQAEHEELKRTSGEPSAKFKNHPFIPLSSEISADGKKLSKGERQLLCLARALLTPPKVMILDEATANVDMNTDASIRQSIREEFGRNSSTLLVIAHRLSTIADFDRVLVIDGGRVAEMGSPKELMEKNGIFKDLVEYSGDKELVENIIFKGESYVAQSV